MVSGRFKNGKISSTAGRSSPNIMTATITNGDVTWIKKGPSQYGYFLAPTPGSTEGTLVEVVMEPDGGCGITVKRAGIDIYHVDIASEHPSALEKNTPTVNVIKQP